jgi:hypothetical protein
MIMLNWPLVLITTVVLYALIIITLPFNAVYATLFLFALIGFWSRLPGVGIPHPFYILYILDLIDIFTVIIAVNIGGPVAAVYSIFGNVWSRMCGSFPAWNPLISDFFAQPIAALILPFFHQAMGGDILVTVIIFTLVRGILLVPFDQIFYRIPLPKYIMEMVGGGAALLLVNGFYATFFGDYFDNLMQKGVAFSWSLFLFATAVIIIFYISVFGKSKKVKSDPFKQFVKAMKRVMSKKKPNKYEPVSEDMEEIKREI